MVRSRIELRCIEDVQKRRVCFSKRRAGLMKKASELSVLCNAEVGVIVFSGTGRLYEFASSSMPQIIRRYNKFTGPSLSSSPSSSSSSSLPSPSRAQPDLSHLLAQQAEEIRSLKEEVMMLETENMSLLKEVEHLSNRQPICYENANLETTLTLRPPSSNAGMRMEVLRKEFGSTSKMQM